MFSSNCCPHIAELCSALEQLQEENIRLLIENESLKETNEELTVTIQEEIDRTRNHDSWFEREVDLTQ